MSKNIFKGEADLLEGPLFTSIIQYSVPIIIGSLIQVLFNAADLAVLGNMADKISVASVGATGAIVGLLVNTFIGISGGTSVVLARFTGAGDKENISKTIDTSMISSLAIGLVITALSIVLAGPLLNLTHCPPECFEGAKLYLIIYFSSIPAIMVYNFGAAILRTGGDSKSPLYYLIFCGILNVILNIVLCLAITEKKIVAVAVATVASQVLGALLVTLKLIRSETVIHFNLKKPSFDGKIFRKILRHGIPSGFSSALYSIANLQIQSSINNFGPDLIAGSSAAGNLETIVCAFTNSFATASFSFVGQNLGANKTKRVKDTIKICLAVGASIGLVLGLGFYLLGRPLLSIFIPGEEEAIGYGLIRMKYILAFYAFAACMQVNGAVLQSFGKSLTPTIINMVFILGFRVVYMTFVYPRFQTVECIFLCYTISWFLCMIALFIALFIVLRGYKKGRKMKF